MNNCGWVRNGGKCILEQEIQELKKQLTTYQILHRDCKVDNLKNISKIEEMENQQKEFIEWLENGINQVRNTEFLDEIIQRAGLVAYNRVLSKYKKIIGVPISGLDDEEEPDLFEMIEDMKNKSKHIEEINKSYPIFNFDEKSFEAMKDMLQDVYSKQVEIIKSVNYLFDKDERQHRKNNESPAELN